MVELAVNVNKATQPSLAKAWAGQKSALFCPYFNQFCSKCISIAEIMLLNRLYYHKLVPGKNRK